MPMNHLSLNLIYLILLGLRLTLFCVRVLRLYHSDLWIKIIVEKMIPVIIFWKWVLLLASYLLMRPWEALLLTFVISFYGQDSKTFSISAACSPHSVSPWPCDLELPSRSTWQPLLGFRALTFQSGWKFCLKHPQCQPARCCLANE